MKRVWSKLPSRWIREGGLRVFGPEGGAAALKLYMALALSANFKPSPTAEVAGLARLTFSELEALCDISRRYVSLGLALLAAQAYITVERVGTAHRYRLTGFDDAGWAKLPRAHLLEARRFQSVGIRGLLSLHAVKLYLRSLPSYDKIEHYTGIARRMCGRDLPAPRSPRCPHDSA